MDMKGLRAVFYNELSTIQALSNACRNPGKFKPQLWLKFLDLKRGTHLADFQHILTAGNLNYGKTEICSIF